MFTRKKIVGLALVSYLVLGFVFCLSAILVVPRSVQAQYSSFTECVAAESAVGSSFADQQKVCCPLFPTTAGCSSASNTNAKPPANGSSNTTFSCAAGYTAQNGLCLPNSPFTGGVANKTDLMGVITFAVQILLTFAGAVAVIFLVVGGYWYITAAGNEETAEKGKKTLINAIIGVVIVLLSYAIITIVVNTLVKDTVIVK